MGFRVQLIAVSGKEQRATHSECGVVASGQFEEIPDAPVSGAMLPNGTYLLYINDQILPNDRIFRRLSHDASLVACYVNETVMNCFICAWANGVEKWSVFHDAQQGLTHLEVTGSPPEELDKIRDRHFAAQESRDDFDSAFDIPVELFVAVGGIRYDQDIPDASVTPWKVLDRLL